MIVLRTAPFTVAVQVVPMWSGDELTAGPEAVCRAGLADIAADRGDLRGVACVDTAGEGSRRGEIVGLAVEVLFACGARVKEPDEPAGVRSRAAEVSAEDAADLVVGIDGRGRKGRTRAGDGGRESRRRSEEVRVGRDVLRGQAVRDVNPKPSASPTPAVNPDPGGDGGTDPDPNPDPNPDPEP